MNDTHREIAELLKKKYQALSGEERIAMGSEMYTTAREIVLASFPQNLSLREQKQRYFLRVYGKDFPENQRKKILASL